MLPLPDHSFIKRDEWIVLIVALLKVFFVFVSVYFTYRFFTFNELLHFSNFLYPEDTLVRFTSYLKTWDANWYLYLADQGYTGGPSNAFYPLYPFLIFLLKPFFGLFLSGLILSNVFFVGSVYLLYRLVRKIYSRSIALLSALLLVVFPTSFYFSLIYTESLFLFLALATFVGMYERRFWLAALCSGLAIFTKAQGVFLFFPLLITVLAHRKSVKDFLVLLGPVLGFVLLHSLLFVLTGEWWSLFKAQQFFVAGFSLRQLFSPMDWLLTDFLRTDLAWHGFVNSILDRTFFVGFLLLLAAGFRRLDLRLTLFLFAMGLVPALSGPLMAYTRYLLVGFPLFILLALFLQHRKYVTVGVGAVLFVFQFYLILRHTTNEWVA